MATITATGTACSDCVQIIANDEGTDAHRARMTAWLDGFEGHPVVTCTGDEENDDYTQWHLDFATSQCDTCGSWDAGDRCPVAWLL